MYLNKTMLVGNVTRDIELKALPSGSKVANFSIATNRSWRTEQGEKKEEVEYHNIIAFGKTAETIAKWVKKGHSIYIEGRLQTKNWEKDGVKHYRTEIFVENFQFGNNPKKETSNEPKEEISIDYGEEIKAEDIPF